MTDQHPITPPQDKFDRWEDNILNERENVDFVLDCVWKDGFKTGADQELEACCKWLASERYGTAPGRIRNHRRPKPPTLKEQALESVKRFESGQDRMGDLDTIRQALEALPND
jgi:hypothetical protein